MFALVDGSLLEKRATFLPQNVSVQRGFAVQPRERRSLLAPRALITSGGLLKPRCCRLWPRDNYYYAVQLVHRRTPIHANTHQRTFLPPVPLAVLSARTLDGAIAGAGNFSLPRGGIRQRSFHPSLDNFAKISEKFYGERT